MRPDPRGFLNSNKLAQKSILVEVQVHFIEWKAILIEHRRLRQNHLHAIHSFNFQTVEGGPPFPLISFSIFHFYKSFPRSYASAAVDSSISKLHDDDSIHHHHHTYDEQFAFDSAEALFGSSELVQKRLDRPYRPRVGEILVKDSKYYQKGVAPQSRQWTRRHNYWPLIDNAVTSLAAKAAASANDVKNLLKVNFLNHFDHVNAAVEHKKQKFKSVVLSAAQNAHHHPLLRGQHPWLGKHPLLPQKQRLVKNIKPPVIIHSETKPLPSTTISEDYIHTYDNNYVPPPYVAKGRPEKNPYASMGVTSYKHFEDTILKELEEKEERKVEATIHTLLDDKYILQETLLGTKPADEEDDADHDEWTPLNNSGGNIIPQQSTLFNTARPYPSSELQTGANRPFNDIRPVCEQLNDISVSPTLFHPSGASSYHEQQAASNENAIKILPHESKKIIRTRYNSNKTATALKAGPTPTTERPNYPAYFIKQQQQVKKLQQKLLSSHRGLSHGQKVLQRQKFGHQIHATPPTTASSLLFYPFNNTDDGFRPIIPSDIASIRNIKPMRNTATDTTLFVDAYTTTLPSTHKPYKSQVKAIKAATSTVRTTIQAQPSNVRVSIVAAPAIRSNATTTTAPRTVDSSMMRKTATKKFTPTEKPSNRNATAAYKATQKTSRGSIKFQGSSLQLKR